MEQPNSIDQLLRQRLQHAEVPPPGHVWANVKRSIRRPRRKRRFLLWLFAACLASAGLWALWQAYTPAPVANQAIRNPAQSPAASSKQAASTATAGQQAAGPAPEIAVISEPTEQPAIKSATAAAGQAPTDRQKTPKSVPELVTTTITPVSQTVEIDRPPTNKPANLTNDLPEEFPVPGHAQTDVAPTETARLNPEAPALLAIPNRRPHLALLKLPPIKKKTPKKCYDFYSNRQAWLLDVYAGPSLIQKGLDTADPEYKSYVQDRFASEKHQWAFNAGVRASYLFAGNFALRTGLHYDQFVEQFEYIDPNFIKYTVVITQEYINGQWVSVPDTVDIQYGSNYVKTYNRFALLDIPLQAALELRSGATGISLNLGGSLNVLFHKQGSMLALNDKPADLEQYQVFRPKVGLSLLGSIQWFYHVTPRTRIFAEPYYRHILEPVTQSGYPVEQSYGIGGIRFGLTQIFDIKDKG